MAYRKGKQEEKYKTDIKTKDFYEYFAFKFFKKKKKVRSEINRNHPYYLTLQEYSEILDLFNKRICKDILYESFDFNLPHSLGLLGIRKIKNEPYVDSTGEVIIPLPVDWKKTLTLWETDPEAKKSKKLVRHYNPHSNGYIAKWYYSVAKANFKNKSLYAFKPTRSNKTELGKIMLNPTNKIDYYTK